MGGAEEAAFDRLVAHLFGIDPPAVITEGQADVARFIAGDEIDFPDRIFAGEEAFIGSFDTVIDGVAQHVQQDRLEDFQHHPVKLDLGATDGKV